LDSVGLRDAVCIGTQSGLRNERWQLSRFDARLTQAALDNPAQFSTSKNRIHPIEALAMQTERGSEN
jgi:hypothetical protein